MTLLRPVTVTLLRPQSIASACQVSAPTVYRWIQDAEVVPAFWIEGRQPLFVREQVPGIVAWRAEQVAARNALRVPKVDA